MKPNDIEIPAAGGVDLELDQLTCRFCGTRFNEHKGRGDGYVAKHEERCEHATEEERAHYRAHRRWPLKKREEPVFHHGPAICPPGVFCPSCKLIRRGGQPAED